MSKKRPEPGASVDEILDYSTERGRLHDHTNLDVEKASYAESVARMYCSPGDGYSIEEKDIFRAGYYHGMKSKDEG
jgi:hypothetical protein